MEFFLGFLKEAKLCCLEYVVELSVAYFYMCSHARFNSTIKLKCKGIIKIIGEMP